jgi:hypothetical protein
LGRNLPPRVSLLRRGRQRPVANVSWYRARAAWLSQPKPSARGAFARVPHPSQNPSSDHGLSVYYAFSPRSLPPKTVALQGKCYTAESVRVDQTTRCAATTDAPVIPHASDKHGVGMNFMHLHPVIHSALLKEALVTGVEETIENFAKLTEEVQHYSDEMSDDVRASVLREIYRERSQKFGAIRDGLSCLRGLGDTTCY